MSSVPGPGASCYLRCSLYAVDRYARLTGLHHVPQPVSNQPCLGSS